MLQKIIILSSLFFLSSLYFNTSLAADFPQLDGLTQANNWSVSIKMTGGSLDDRAIFDTAGRETQIYKMINSTIGLSYKAEDFIAELDFVLLSDETRHDPNNAAYVDYYKNIGTDLLYYGEFPVKNAYFQVTTAKNIDVKVGRMVNLHGFDYDHLPYTNRHDAPHAIYLDKEILNGFELTSQKGFLNLSGALLNGRGRPDSDYNFYLNGQTDPNIKDNNTPVIEVKAQLGQDSKYAFASYHRNKTGSAPGIYGNGKYNDNRLAFGSYFQGNFKTNLLQSIEVWSQYSIYEIGLTESGVQKELSESFFGTSAKDLEKKGYFATLRANLNRLWSIQYTTETLDRIDSNLWLNVANQTDNHPSLSAKEKSQIYSLNYQISKPIALSFFYRTMENPYPGISGITTLDSQRAPNKMGLILTMEIK